MPSEINETQAAGITPTDVRSYVLGRGWESLDSRNEAIAIFVKPGTNVQIQVPQRGNARDFELMMRKVLHQVAETEERQLDEVSQDLRNPCVDAFRMRVKSRLAATGTLPLNEGLKLFEGGRKLLVSAACSAVTPRAFHPRKSFKEAEDFIRRCRVGQTAIGSYVASILCPKLPPVEPTLFEGVDDAPPYPRQVTQNLMKSLGVLIKAARTGDASLIEKGVEQGVSANLCDALSSISPPEEHSVLQLEMCWSPIRPPSSKSIPAIASFTAPDLDFVRDAGTKLRSITVRQSTVEGRIASLKEQQMLIGEMGRTVEIRAKLDDRAVLIRFGLDEDQYRQACDAYRDHKLVRVAGTLHRDDRSRLYDFQQIDSFEVLQ